MKKLLLGMLVLCLSCSFVGAEEAAPDYPYRVKRGDNLTRLSRDVLDQPSRWPDVAKYNKLPNKHLIYPGEILRIPYEWLKNYPASARIEDVSGEVRLNSQPAKVGDEVTQGGVIETFANASALLILPDGSSMSVLENTRLRATRLDRKKDGDYFSAELGLDEGRVDATKKKYPYANQAPLSIRAKNATIGIRGTHFRLGQEGGNTLAEVENGLVAFEAGKSAAALALSGGQGSLADGVNPPAVIPLLPAPQYPDMPTEFSRGVVSFTMPEMEGARGFRGEVAKDAGFTKIIAPVRADNHLIKLAMLGDGHYWLRLRAVDKHGLQGLAANVPFAIKIVPPITVTPEAPTFSSEKLLTRWRGEAGFRYELQIADNEKFVYPLVSIITQDNELGVPRPESGRYYMRLRATDADGQAGQWSEIQVFSVPQL